MVLQGKQKNKLEMKMFGGYKSVYVLANAMILNTKVLLITSQMSEAGYVLD